MSRRAALTTGVDVWGYFAAHLYSHPLLSIVTRELYQNARDACRRAGRPAGIALVVVADEGFRYGHVTCRDDGCGMDEDTILDRFLCLGGTDKGEGDTGGFGIAKAVILGGCTWWEVRTHDLYVSMDHVREGRPVDTGLPWLEGARITLRYDPLPEHDPRHDRLRMSRWALAQALSWLAHGDSPCTVVVRGGQGRPQAWRFEGVQVSPEKLVAEGQMGRTTWRLYQVPPQEIDPLRAGDWTCDIASAGKLFVRLHGLVQFTIPMGEHPDGWILDVETEALPPDPDYPFSLSREELAGDLRREIDSILETHRANPVSSHRRQFRVHDRPTTLIFPGEWLGRDRGGYSQASSSVPLRAEGGQQALRLSAFAQATDAVYRGASPLGYTVMVKGVDRTRRDVLAPHNLRLLAAWAQVVELVVDAGGVQEQFGVGFLFDADDYAERVESTEGVFYLVNPRLVGLAASRPRETLLKLFTLAGHEVAHERYPNHGEPHSSWMGELLIRAAGPFAARLGQLTRDLSGRRPSPLARRLQMSFEEWLSEEER